MRIVVLAKEVPDTWSDRRIDPDTKRVVRDDVVTDEITERATEVALQRQDSDGDEVIVLTMGPASSAEMLRRLLAMGADSAVHILDDELVGSDLGRTAQVLAAAIASLGFDLVIAGNESTDGRGGVLAAMIAERLGIPHATSLSEVEIAAGEVTGRRESDHDVAQVRAALPAVISVTERVAEPRFASFRNIMKAKKKPLTTLSTADLELPVGGARSVVLSVVPRPPRQTGTRIVDEGDAGVQLADFLLSHRLI